MMSCWSLYAAEKGEKWRERERERERERRGCSAAHTCRCFFGRCGVCLHFVAVRTSGLLREILLNPSTTPSSSANVIIRSVLQSFFKSENQSQVSSALLASLLLYVTSASLPAEPLLSLLCCSTSCTSVLCVLCCIGSAIFVLLFLGPRHKPSVSGSVRLLCSPYAVCVVPAPQPV